MLDLNICTLASTPTALSTRFLSKEGQTQTRLYAFKFASFKDIVLCVCVCVVAKSEFPRKAGKIDHADLQRILIRQSLLI